MFIIVFYVMIPEITMQRYQPVSKCGGVYREMDFVSKCPVNLWTVGSWVKEGKVVRSSRFDPPVSVSDKIDWLLRER